jgi:hypothetical protein
MPNSARHVGTSVHRIGGGTGVPRHQVGIIALARWAFCYCLTAIAMSACTSSSGGVPTGSATPSPVQAVTTADRSSDTRLLTPFHPGRVVYDLRVTSVIQSLLGDSIPRTDSVRLNSVVSAEFMLGVHELQIEAAVQTDSTRLVSTSSPPLQFQVSQHKYIIDRTGQVHSTSTTPQVCSTQIDNPIRGEEILPRFPAMNSLLDAWSDTTLYDLCRGGVLLRAKRVSTYRRIASLSDSPTVQFIRQSYLTLTGRGSQWDQPVEATGSGDSVDTLTLSRTQPRLTRIVGSARFEVKFLSRFRNQVLRQSSQSELHLRP